MNVEFRCLFNIASEFILLGTNRIQFHIYFWAHSKSTKGYVDSTIWCWSMTEISCLSCNERVSGMKQENKNSQTKIKLFSTWRKLGLVDIRDKQSSLSQPSRDGSQPSQPSSFLPSWPMGAVASCGWVQPAVRLTFYSWYICTPTDSTYIHCIHTSWPSWFSTTPMFIGLPDIRMCFKST